MFKRFTQLGATDSDGPDPRSGRLRGAATLTLILLACVAILMVWRGRDSTQTPVAVHRDLPASRNTDGYVGADACRECHSQRVEEFLETAHSRTSRRPDNDEMLGRLAAAGAYYQSRNPDCRFEIVQRPEDFALTAITQTATGEHHRTEAIALVYGAGTADEVFHYWNGNKLFELPIAFMHSTQKWANAPGYYDGSADFQRETTSRCLECHNTWIGQVPGSSESYDREYFIPGVSCERCHGPAERHVTYHRDNPGTSAAMHITNPGQLSRDLQLEVCAQCHSNTQHRRTAPFSYRPGQRLEDHFRTDQGTFPEKDHTANQLRYLKESKCFQSETAMTCTTCHDPHLAAGMGNAASVINSCYGCHKPDHCDEQENLPAPVREQCIGCHMPERSMMNIWYSTATDDFLPITRRHNHRIGIYPEATKAVLLEWYRQQKDAVSTNLAQQLTQQLVDSDVLRARELYNSFRWTAAIGEYREALRLQPSEAIKKELASVIDDLLELEGLEHVAAQQLREQDLEAATDTLTRMLQSKPNEAMVRGKLGLALAATGRRNDATRELSAVGDYDPDLSYGDALLGWICYVENRLLDSARHYEIAIAKTPWNAKLQYQYSLTLIRLDRREAAEKCLRAALKIDPGYHPARDELNRLFLRRTGGATSIREDSQ